MKQSIGLTYTLNFIIVFIVITFAFLFGIMSYYKAFKVNSRVSNAIENHEGYNSLSVAEIDNVLGTLGYVRGATNCPSRKYKGKEYTSVASAKDLDYALCIYEYPVDPNTGYFRYGVVTYIHLDIPVIEKTLKLPVYSETEKIYQFNE